MNLSTRSIVGFILAAVVGSLIAGVVVPLLVSSTSTLGVVAGIAIAAVLLIGAAVSIRNIVGLNPNDKQ